MTYAVWPSQLPRPERSSWQSQPQDTRVKRQSDAGPPAYRRRFSLAATTVTLSVLLDRSEKAVFDQFWQITTRSGSGLFWMLDPTTDGWPLLTSDGLPMLDGAGSPILLSAQWLCLFGDPTPRETIEGVEFRKSFAVVVMP